MLDTTYHLPYGSEYLVEAVPLFGSGTSRPDRRAHPHHRVLIITGESGTGKTMLLRYFQHNQTRCFMGAGDPVDSALEFHAWSGIIREMLNRTIKTHKTLLHIGGSSDKSISSAASSVVMARVGPTDADLRVRTRPDELIDNFLRLEAARESQNNNEDDECNNDNNNNNTHEVESDHSHSYTFQLPGTALDSVSPVGVSQTSSGRHSPRVAMEVSTSSKR
ncbi:hypothetical protein ATCC90586_010537 [Pythium insidiosum]|nr:hypothetical protein ATCC90586_010537 [Pythium insidiosum]